MIEKATAICPNCNNTYEFKKGNYTIYFGKCPYCGYEVVIEKEDKIQTVSARAVCKECENVYEFEKNIGVTTHVECPCCGTKGTVDSTDQIFEQPRVGLKPVKKHKKFPLKQVAGMVVVICVFSIVLLFVNGFIDFSHEVVIKEVEVIKEVPLPQEPEYMEGVGYEFTDTREPTEEELFVMEESLNLCYNPTYNEVATFIKNDDVNEYEATDDFDCDEFSYYIIELTREEKTRGGFVIIYPVEDELADELYEDNPPHAIVVFDTTDNGLIFVEPQTDNIFTYNEFIAMQTANHYYTEDEWGYYIEMDFDHYVIDWFSWYYFYNEYIDWCHLELVQTWNLYKSEYPNFKTSYDEYFVYEVDE